MSKSNAFEGDLLDLIFLGTAIPNLADNAATSPFTQYWLSLHTADPGEAGDQSTSEATYGGYTRIAVARSSAGWSRTGSQVTNVGTLTFPGCTSGSNVITHAAVGTAQTGAGKYLYSGQLTASKTISTSNTPPDFAPGQIVIGED